MKNKIFETMTIILLILIIFSEITIYDPLNFFSKPNLTLDYTIKGDRIQVNYTLSAGYYPMNMKMLIFGCYYNLSNISKIDKDIYIYYDPTYQSVGVSKIAAKAIFGHLISELKIRRYNGKVKVVNATELKELLLKKSISNKSVLIITQGAFPDTVYSLEYNLVKPWIESGGTLIWVGDMFAYYSAKKSREKINYLDPWHPREYGQRLFFNDIIIIPDKSYTSGDIDTEYSATLNLKFDYTYLGIQISEILIRNGTIIGKMSKDKTSIGLIPIGKGKIIIFGGRLFKAEDSRTFVEDVSQLLLSHIIDYCPDILVVKSYSLNRKEILKLDEEIPKVKYKSFLIYMFQTDIEGSIFERWIINDKKSNRSGH